MVLWLSELKGRVGLGWQFFGEGGNLRVPTSTRSAPRVRTLLITSRAPPCMVHLPRFRLIFWVNVGKYTSPMDPMGGVDATNDAVDRVVGLWISLKDFSP